jgi:hypothetical protein
MVPLRGVGTPYFRGEFAREFPAETSHAVIRSAGQTASVARHRPTLSPTLSAHYIQRPRAKIASNAWDERDHGAHRRHYANRYSRGHLQRPTRVRWNKVGTRSQPFLPFLLSIP